jgi:hypothetical protein
MEEIECIYNKLIKALPKKSQPTESQIEIEIEIAEEEPQGKEEQTGDI